MGGGNGHRRGRRRGLEIGWDGNDWSFGRIVTQHILNGANADETEWTKTFIKSTISGPNGARVVVAMADFDLSGDLHDIAVPTMVLQSEGDIAVPSAHSIAVSAAISGAIHIDVPSDHHVPMVATSPWSDAIRAVIAFLDDQ